LEFVQDDASPENIAAEIIRILTDREYAERLKSGLALVEERLGGGGTDQRMASLALQMMETA
jgi:lipid-A-disaccharide synthase